MERLDRPTEPNLTLEAYARAANLPAEFLKKLGIVEAPYAGGTAVVIPFLTAGSDVEIAAKIVLARDDAGESHRWRTGSRPAVYGLWRIDLAQATRAVILVEDELDALTCWYHGIPAVAVPPGAALEPDWARALDGIDNIFALRAPVGADAEVLVQLLGDGRLRERVRIVDLGNETVNELYKRAGSGFEPEFARCLDQSTVAAEEERAAAAERRELTRKNAWERCESLALRPRILDSVAEVSGAMGVVGNTRVLRMTYLALVSRLLPEPISLVVKGPSASGKSFETQQALRFFPPSSYFELTALTERALARLDEPLRHRMLVLFEAPALANPFAAYLLRSLLSEGRIRYLASGNPSEILEVEGPTGLVVTTTSHLEAEIETRLISLDVDDSPEQTQRILASLAGGRAADVDLDAFHALQEWLEIAGERRVEIPYARRLAEQIPPVDVRLRRDFRQLLGLIRTHALLHQATRARNEADCIIAEVDDYTVVYELVSDLFGASPQGPMTPAHETVAAVSALLASETGNGEAVSIDQIADHLKLHKGSTSRRVAAAIRDGHLVNLEPRKGRRARIVVGEPLPGRRDLLPKPELLAFDPEPAASSAASRGCEITSNRPKIGAEVL